MRTRFRSRAVSKSRGLAALLVIVMLASCHREERALTPDAPSSQRAKPVRISDLQPGPKQLAATALENPYEGNAYAISQGQQLFDQYNCSGCHFHGGGGIGPALMDDEWIYGHSPTNIFMSISEGRPNGMPSYGGHIPDAQIWQLTTYVRSVGGFEPQGATAPRNDAMQARKSEEPK
jgi:cytochrome c oxidase cbb3-type subunit 3